MFKLFIVQLTTCIHWKVKLCSFKPFNFYVFFFLEREILSKRKKLAENGHLRFYFMATIPRSPLNKKIARVPSSGEASVTTSGRWHSRVIRAGHLRFFLFAVFYDTKWYFLYVPTSSLSSRLFMPINTVKVNLNLIDSFHEANVTRS